MGSSDKASTSQAQCGEVGEELDLDQEPQHVTQVRLKRFVDNRES